GRCSTGAEVRAFVRGNYRRGGGTMKSHRLVTLTVVAAPIAVAIAALSTGAAPAASLAPAGSLASAASAKLASPPAPQFSRAVAFDVSPPLRALASRGRSVVPNVELRPERGPAVRDIGFAGDGAVQKSAAPLTGASIPSPLQTF